MDARRSPEGIGEGHGADVVVEKHRCVHDLAEFFRQRHILESRNVRVVDDGSAPDVDTARSGDSRG